jgi:DNA-binding response OmpR family regulator
MIRRILIVEDQPLIAVAVDDAVTGLGHRVCGIAASKKNIDEVPNIALVDVNLLEGPTGPESGHDLAARAFPFHVGSYPHELK